MEHSVNPLIGCAISTSFIIVLYLINTVLLELREDSHHHIFIRLLHRLQSPYLLIFRPTYFYRTVYSGYDAVLTGSGQCGNVMAAQYRSPPPARVENPLCLIMITVMLYVIMDATHPELSRYMLLVYFTMTSYAIVKFYASKLYVHCRRYHNPKPSMRQYMAIAMNRHDLCRSIMWYQT